MKYNENNKPLVCMMTQSTCYKGTKTFTPKGILWHSTGANNPNLKRYVQPDDNAIDREEWIARLGKNQYANDWNHINRQAGLNFWIGKLADGTVAAVQTMPWNYRPWGCGSGSKGSLNDTHIQFEICEDALTDASYFNAVYREACEMTAYLCKMFGIDPKGSFTYKGVTVPTIIDHAGSHSLGMGSNHGDVQHWFKRYGKTLDNVRDDVAKLLTEETSTQPAVETAAVETAPVTPAPTETDAEKTIWDFLYGKLGNAYGAAGLMGNLYAESALRPTNLQNTYEKKLGLSDTEYTAAVDNGSYDNFIRDSAGYGLAQWTYWSRKQALLQFAQAAGKSIGDLQMQLDFLWCEIQEYASVLNTLKTAATVRAASDAVLTGYERPADQSEAVQVKRVGYGQGYYDKYASSAPAKDPANPITQPEDEKTLCPASKVIAVATGEIGYKEKASNASLDNPTANAGSANYTKYARDFDQKYPRWYNGKKNGYAWCFTEDALILTENGYKRIQDIDIGDRVLNAHGDRFNTVTKIFVHDAEVKDYRFYGAIPFSATPDHPFLSQTRKNRWHRKNGFTDFGFHEIDTLNRGDVAAVPHSPVLHNTGLSYDDWWVAGYFAGDGYWNPGKDSFELFANENKAAKVDKHALGYWEKDYASHTCKCFRLDRNNPRLMEVLRDCGRGAVNKRVPNAVLFGSTEAKKAFMDGYLAADGCENSNGFNSVSAELVTGIARLLSDIGTMCAINPQTRKPTGRIFDKRLNAWRTFHQQDVIYNCYVSVTEDKRHQDYVAGDKYTFIPLRNKGENVRTDTVYTITTDGDHTYTVNNIGVHNCDMFVDWCFLTAYGYENALRLLCQPERSAGAGCTYSLRYYKNKGQFHTGTPKVGDQIFFGTSLDNSTHTGIVEKVESGKVHTIEGNTSDQVARRSYALSNSRILGYGRPAYDAEGAADSATSPAPATPTTPTVDGQTEATVPFLVRISIPDLNIRKGPGTNYARIGQYTGKGVFTIVEVASGAGSASGWGRLKSGLGWVSLDYCARI